MRGGKSLTGSCTTAVISVLFFLAESTLGMLLVKCRGTLERVLIFRDVYVVYLSGGKPRRASRHFLGGFCIRIRGLACWGESRVPGEIPPHIQAENSAQTYLEPTCCTLIPSAGHLAACDRICGLRLRECGALGDCGGFLCSADWFPIDRPLHFA